MRIVSIVVLVACNTLEAGVSLPTDKSGDTGDTGSGGVDTDTEDTVDTDDDQDDDGFSTAEGDCDDADVHVSPARDEEGGDGKDNDCDGRVDENFTGVDVCYVTGEGEGHIYTIDTIGRLTADVQTGDCIPFFLDHAPVGQGSPFEGGWIINDSLAAVSYVSPAGECTQLVDLSDTDVYPFAPFGVTVTPSGEIFVALGDGLLRVGWDGSVERLATWDAENEFFAVGLANDPLTGTVGVFDMLGGFATYGAEAGFEFQLLPDFSSPSAYTVSGAHGDNGIWYVPGFDYAAGTYGVLGFDPEAKEWVLQDTWSEAGWDPWMMTVDADDPDRVEFYVAATSTSAYQTVWRVIHGSNAAEHLWISEGSDFGAFYGIVSNMYE